MTRRTTIRRTPRARHAHLSSARKVAFASAYRALRDYERQYETADPGNSAEWTAAWAAASTREVTA
jgi:hypothetical protein